MLASKIFTVPCKISRYMDRTFSLYETDHLGHRVLRWYRDQHMYMIGSKVTFQNLTLFLCCEFLEC